MSRPETLPSDSLSTSNKPASPFVPAAWLRYGGPLLLLALFYCLLYREGLIWLLEIWSHNDYSYGYLVPIVSLYILWEQRERYRQLPFKPAILPAGMIILSCLLLLIISRASAFIQFQAASLFLIIPGILLLIFGRQITRAALVPWLYLSFALPWFDLFIGIVQPPFQRFTALISSRLLSLFYPVYLNDIFIQLPSITMEVAKECSGVNFFIAVLAIGAPLVYLSQRSWIRAFLVLILGLLITMLANGLRVTLAGISGEILGPALLHGPAHILQGMFVAWFGWIGLFVINWIVAKGSDPATPRLFQRWKLHTIQITPKEQVGRISTGRMYVASGILALCAIVGYFESPRPVYLSPSLASLPTTLPDWKSYNSKWFDLNTLFPGADEQLERVYSSRQSDTPIYLNIAYFNKQTEHKRLIRYFAQPLYKKSVRVSLPSPSPGISPFIINKTTLSVNGTPCDVFFWYQFANHKIVTGQNQARLAALENGILHRRNNGAVVLIAIQQNPAEKNDPTSVPESVSRFLKDAGPGIISLLP